MTPDQALFRITMFVKEHGGADHEIQSALTRLEDLVLENKELKVQPILNDCGHQCFIIGGPFIAQDPNCPVHGRQS